MGKVDRAQDLKWERLGNRVFFIYRLFRFLVFAFNIFIIYSMYNKEPQFLTLALVLNIIWFLIYNHRITFLATGLVLSYLLISKDTFELVTTGIVIGNSICYIVDFIRRKLFTLLIRIMQASNK